MGTCIFCEIAVGRMKAEVVAETEDLVAFRDIGPQAPTHVLIIPRRHIATLNDLVAGDAELVGKMLLLAGEIAGKEGIAGEGYRTIFNCNRGAGQSVWHLHLHVLGGRPLGWPPG